MYGDDIMKLNKKGRKRGPQARQVNTDLGMGIELTDSKSNGNGDHTPKSTGYRSKYAQPVVGSYGS